MVCHSMSSMWHCHHKRQDLDFSDEPLPPLPPPPPLAPLPPPPLEEARPAEVKMDKKDEAIWCLSSESLSWSNSHMFQDISSSSISRKSLSYVYAHGTYIGLIKGGCNMLEQGAAPHWVGLWMGIYSQQLVNPRECGPANSANSAIPMHHQVRMVHPPNKMGCWAPFDHRNINWCRISLAHPLEDHPKNHPWVELQGLLKNHVPGVESNEFEARFWIDDWMKMFWRYGSRIERRSYCPLWLPAMDVNLLSRRKRRWNEKRKNKNWDLDGPAAKLDNHHLIVIWTACLSQLWFQCLVITEPLNCILWGGRVESYYDFKGWDPKPGVIWKSSEK